ncbi:MAG: DNA ligase [Syntrophomonadaceae bacterium]|nr:DNA ligase [Bacillota bacterium]
MPTIRPMLAASATEADLQKMKYPVLGSAKIDGVRALIINGVVTSRSGKAIPNLHVQETFGKPYLEGYDGELVVGSAVDYNCMQHTVSGVMSRTGTPSVTFCAFDRWDMPDKVFSERGWSLLELQENVVVLQNTIIRNYDALRRYESCIISAGYEGIILRNPQSKYKFGRSTFKEGSLLKVKRFQDSEAIIIGFLPLYRNENEAKINDLGYIERSTCQDNKVEDNMLGSLIVKDVKTNIEFSIGSGFNNETRRKLWEDPSKLLGKMVKYKSFLGGVKEAPRFPIFLGFRDLLDL